LLIDDERRLISRNKQKKLPRITNNYKI
jgi:hypothetical protein